MKIWYGTFLIALYASSSFAIDCPGNQGKKYNKNALNNSLNCVNSGLKALELTGQSVSTDMGSVKGTLGSLTTDLATLKSNVNALLPGAGTSGVNLGSLPADVSALKSTVGTLNASVSSLNTRMATAESNIAGQEKGLTQLEDDVALLKGITPQPLINGYDDNYVRVEVSGQSKSTDANGNTTVRVAFLAKNKSAGSLLLGQDVGTITVTDENGVSCSVINLTGLPSVVTNSAPTAYSSIAVNSSLSFVWESFGSCRAYTGHVFNVSFQLMRYDSTSKFGVPFTVGFTGLSILPR